jgi:hypothetical protein
MKTETGEIISKKEALVREAMECGFQRFEAEAFYNCLRRFQQQEREACAKVCEDLDAWNMDDPASTAAEAIRARGQA